MFGVGSSGVGFRGLGCSRPFRAQCVRCEDLGVQGVSVSSKFQGFRVQGGLWHKDGGPVSEYLLVISAYSP